MDYFPLALCVYALYFVHFSIHTNLEQDDLAVISKRKQRQNKDSCENCSQFQYVCGNNK